MKRHIIHTANNTKDKRNWVPGFTLLEVLIVILLTAIVISLTFLYFSTFNRYVAQINSSAGFELQVLRFESLLYYDVDRATEIKINEGPTTYVDFIGTEVSYIFKEDMIIREQYENNDTLQCKEVIFTPGYLSEVHNTLVGLGIELTDKNNRIRAYMFEKKQSSGILFEQYWRNEN